MVVVMMMARSDFLRGLAVAAVAAVVAVGLLLAVWGARPAEAAFPGENGKIAFMRSDSSGGNAEIYVMDSDGQNQINLTNNNPGR